MADYTIKLNKCPLTGLEIINQEVSYYGIPKNFCGYTVKYKESQHYLRICTDLFNLFTKPEEKDAARLKELYTKLPMLFGEMSKSNFEPIFNSILHWDCPQVSKSNLAQLYIKSYVNVLLEIGHTIPTNEQKFKMVLENLKSLEKFPGDVINVRNNFELWAKSYMANDREFRSYLNELKLQNKLEYENDRVRLRLLLEEESKKTLPEVENSKPPTIFERIKSSSWTISIVVALISVFIFKPTRDFIFSSKSPADQTQLSKKEKNNSEKPLLNNNSKVKNSELVLSKKDHDNKAGRAINDEEIREQFLNYYLILKDETLLYLKEQNKSPKFKNYHLISEALSYNSELQKEIKYSFQNALYNNEKYNFFFESSIDCATYIVLFNDNKVFSKSIFEPINETEFRNNLKQHISSKLDNIPIADSNDSIQ